MGYIRGDTTTAVSQAIFWSATGGPPETGSLLLDASSGAFPINAAGSIAGLALAGNPSSSTNIREPVYWTTSIGAYAIGLMGSMGRSFSKGNDIDDAGQTVGFVTKISGFCQREFLYQAGAMVDLDRFVDAAIGPRC
ncbi:MAG: hypothetical protein ABIR94_06365 [Rubrivivax sp.]